MSRKIFKRFACAILAFALVCALIPSTGAYAAESTDTESITWTKTDEYTHTVYETVTTYTTTIVGDEVDPRGKEVVTSEDEVVAKEVTAYVYTLDGTDITATIDDTYLYISGNGAIPSYNEHTWSYRPWHKWDNIKHLVIDETITSIGEYAFANMSELEDISMYSTTFIEDNSAFTGIAYEPVFHIIGYSETARYIGTIPYTSLDSIKAFAQSTYLRASFLFDQQYMVELFQNSANPTITNVFCYYDSTKPWEDLDENENGNKETELCRVVTATSDGDLSVDCYKQVVGTNYYEAFATVIGTDTLAATYSMEVYRNDVLVRTTLSELCYELQIPAEYQQAGRTFRIISIDKSNVTVHEDLDLSDSTITFSTSTPSTVYALVYSDAVASTDLTVTADAVEADIVE